VASFAAGGFTGAGGGDVGAAFGHVCPDGAAVAPDTVFDGLVVLAVVVAARLGGSARFAPAAADVVADGVSTDEGVFDAASPTTASVSCTGRSAVAGEEAVAGACVAAETGTALVACWREARYPPAPAAAMQVAASAANANRFENMGTISLNSTVGHARRVPACAVVERL